MHPIENISSIIISDAFRLKQVLTNLLVNAFKFTKEGQVEFGVQKMGEGKLLFFVQDTGIGIRQEDLEIIFDRFRQIDNNLTREAGGTGLGLTISKNIIQLLGGEIFVQSEPGKGSCFSFTIPYVPVEEKKNDTQKKDNPDLTEENVWKEYTILVAEDEETNFFFLKELLEFTGINLIRAINGKDALHLYKENEEKIKLIFMDIRMPIMNGIESAKAIKLIDPEIPVIALTAYAMEEDKQLYTQQKIFNEYITKPLKTEILFKLLHQYLKSK